MYYTSYYAAIKKLGVIVPISISRSIPKNVKTERYPKLAPTWDMINGNQDNYLKQYAKILQQLNPQIVLEDLLKLSVGKPFALMCYEKPNEFCHRHLVSEWLNLNLGIGMIEVEKGQAISLF